MTLVAALAIPGVSSGATSGSTVAQEYDLKAAFLFNFARFVEWPADAFAAAATPITIGVLGDDPFGATLDSLVGGELVRNRPLLVRRYGSVEDVDACHILFISSSEAGRLDHIARVLGRRSILTVGDTKDFAADAGIIGFELAQRRLRLRINLAAATDARLTISSKLLRQAQIVRSSRGRK
ncbi:MAG TPA: YfiR family protein [Candidatus Eisenbacteria bacterium]|nr:YfiR family protein [Candidatus Eisenbacteria bacterium]